MENKPINKSYRDEVQTWLTVNFIPAGYCITKNAELDIIPENSKYHALNFELNEFNIVYRKGNNTPDRPGAFVTVWKRPISGESNNNKPIALTSDELDYLFVYVENDVKYGVFIFPITLLINKGIVSSLGKKGKTGFRVFPPWTEDRGSVGMKVFSESGKKTQQWQKNYFVEIDNEGNINSHQLKKVLN